MRQQTKSLVALLAFVALATGCRQGTPIPNPMTALTPSRVPPPATGSYPIPDRYYKGQPVAGQANAAASASTVSLASNNAAVGSGAVGSGVVQSSFVDRNSAAQPTASVQTNGGELGGFRGFAEARQPVPLSTPASNFAPTPQPATSTAQYAGMQDDPPAPKPSTSPLNWQQPVQ
ncbi:hypothetical protein Poly24_44240 [Rosistilla carotiformis]|uniref:Lipoprotein n=1 Tax=Rosistilla carotiformis TaxID=2528017 RepID=A0A518JYS3_9BACT|nr:hypothetical protein [Rosistilla carotiformis]QDV70698.1 hypothetical protein Poly24_44240 [Rosistilla carotiformis]